MVQVPGSRVIVTDTDTLHFKLCFPPRLSFPLCFMRTWRDGFLQTSNASFLSVHFYALCLCDHVPGGSFEGPSTSMLLPVLLFDLVSAVALEVTAKFQKGSGSWSHDNLRSPCLISLLVYCTFISLQKCM